MTIWVSAQFINFAIDQMRGLVSNLNSLSQHEACAAEDTEGAAHNRANTAENQAGGSGPASQAINEMATPVGEDDLSNVSGKLGGTEVALLRLGGEIAVIPNLELLERSVTELKRTPG